jgi:hypothetical protein
VSSALEEGTAITTHEGNLVMSTEWLVNMTFVPDAPVDEKQLDALSDRFDEMDWSVAVGPESAVSVTAFLDEDPGPSISSPS